MLSTLEHLALLKLVVLTRFCHDKTNIFTGTKEKLR